jgi:hypothetical protein
MLSQNLHDKTEDVGKQCGLLYLTEAASRGIFCHLILINVKAKPVAKQGRKATDLQMIAGLPC